MIRGPLWTLFRLFTLIEMHALSFLQKQHNSAVQSKYRMVSNSPCPNPHRHLQTCKLSETYEHTSDCLTSINKVVYKII